MISAMISGKSLMEGEMLMALGVQTRPLTQSRAAGIKFSL